MDPLPFDASDLLGTRGGLIERLARTAHDVILPRPEQLDSQTALAERSLPAFVRQAWHTVEPDRPMVEGWVIDCVCAHLEAVTAGQIRNLIINLPPGFMKSMLCCVMWPAWVWVRDPGSRWIFGSYGQGLAFRDSDRQRDLIQSPWYQARWGHVFQFKRSWNTKERFSNNRQGYRIATTVAGKAMGERADYLCFPPDEVVWTDRGKLPICEIVRGRLPVRAWSVDPETGRYGLKPVTAWHENPGSAIVEVVLSDGATFRCTPDHKIWTVNRGWVRADGLRLSDVLSGLSVLDEVDGLAAHAVARGDLAEGPGIGEDGTDGVLRDAAVGDGARPSRLFQPGRDFPPGIAAANVSHGLRSEPVPGGGLGIRFGRGEDGTGVGSRDLRSAARLADRRGEVAGEFGPGAAGPDDMDVSGGDAVPSGDVFRRIRAQEDGPGVGGGYPGPGAVGPERESAMTFSVGDVLGAGAVVKVVGPAVSGDAVLVPALHAGRAGAVEGEGNASVDAGVDGPALESQVDAQVPEAVGRRTHDSCPEHVGLRPVGGGHGAPLAPDIPQVRSTVQSIESGYRSPLFVRHVGYSEKTYCLTVADYHTMIVGRCQRGIIVSNCYDDPHKPLEVGSRALRESVIRSWTTTMSTRGTDPKTVRKLVIMQRLHERDLSGYLMAEVGGYETLILPMEYEPRRYFLPRGTPAPAGSDGADAGPRERDAIRLTSLQRERPELRDGPGGSGRRFDGDLLWPERFGPAEVEALKATLQGPGTAGQLQQRPAAAEGALFKAEDFRHFTVERDADGALWVVMGAGTPERPEPPRLPAAGLRFFQVADTALKDTETSAYTCIGTFAWHPPSRTLLAWHVWRGRLEVREQMEALKTLREGEAFWDRASRRWVVPGRLAPWPRPLLYQAVEEKASGIGLLQEARAEGYQLLPLRAVLGKAQRAAGAVTMLRQGRVWFRAAAPWLVDFEEELLTFPNGAWSDQADVLSYACMQAATETLLNAAVEGDLTVWPDPRGPGGRPLDPEDVADWDGHRERLNVGGIEVEFDDDPETAWLDG
jgi:hypothetical protein